MLYNANPSQSRPALGALLLVLATVLWGSTFAVVVVAVRIVPPGMLNTVRFGLAAAVAAPFLFRGASRAVMLAGAELAIWLAIGQGLQSVGLLYTTATRSAFITALAVIFVPVLAILLGKRIRATTWVAALLATAGAGLLCYDRTPPSEGDIWTLGAAIVFSVFIVRMETHASRLAAMPLAAATLLATFGCLAMWGLIEFAQGKRISGTFPWIAVLYLGLIATTLTTGLQVLGQRSVPAARAAIIYTLEPVFGAMFAYLIGDRLGPRGWIGSAVILAASLLGNLPAKRHAVRV